MSFATRVEKSQQAIQRFDTWCDNHGIIYAKSGYEDLISNNGEQFKSKIQKLSDETAKRIRYFPDRIVIFNYANLVEVKNGTSIEKDAYETYLDLEHIGYKVGIIFLNNFLLIFSPIGGLKLKAPDTKRTKLPIINQFWLAPREMDDYSYSLWKQNHPNASGTTFGLVDFDSTEWRVLSDGLQQELERIESEDIA